MYFTPTFCSAGVFLRNISRKILIGSLPYEVTVKYFSLFASRIAPILILCIFLFLPDILLAQAAGSITGLIRDDESRESLPYINVKVKDTPYGAASDERGRYHIGSIPPGIYTLAVTGVGFGSVEVSITVEAGKTVTRDFVLKHSAVQVGEVLVYGASFRRERITEAPASVSLIGTKEIGRFASHGQLPKLLEVEPGVDMVQSGMYDFNIVSRGFNSSLNRRLLVLLDGRDLATAFLGATEWNGLSIPLEDLGRLELIRGPGSALYGANAYSGVLNVTSLPPRSNPGTRVILGAGELSLLRGDIRHAGLMGNWSYRVNVGGIRGMTFSKIRSNDPKTNLPRFEYPGLNPFLNTELVDLDLDPVRTLYASARLDYEYSTGGIATLEGGSTQVENEVIVTGIGRVQVQKAQRPWARLSYVGHGFNVNIWTSFRLNSAPERSLSTGLNLEQGSNITQGEIQYSFTALENALSLTTGISHRLVHVDTKGTLMLAERNDNMTGVYAQAEYRFSSKFKSVLAARWDRSTLHSSQFSPKVALVWTPLTDQSFRFTYNQAFQSPNYSELFLHVKHPTRPLAYYGNLVTNPPGLSGFVGGAVPGNPQDLTVENITGYEIGYKGIFEKSLFITLDVYFNQMTNFVTDLAVGVNPKFPRNGGIYPGDVLAPTRTIWSYANVGRVNEAGVDAGINYYLSDHLTLSGNFSYFYFDIVEKHAEDVLIPNSPDYRISGGITYTHPSGHDIGLRIKHVPSFDWAAGIYQGKINEYTVMDLGANYRYSSTVSLNLNISNLMDKEHYQIFGGSLLGRRAIVTLYLNL